MPWFRAWSVCARERMLYRIMSCLEKFAYPRLREGILNVNLVRNKKSKYTVRNVLLVLELVDHSAFLSVVGKSD